jgi:polar amino acid transport system substrate-binding protein
VGALGESPRAKVRRHRAIGMRIACHIQQNPRGDQMFRRALLCGSGAACLTSLASIRQAHADTMADIKARGTLVIGVEAAYVPFCFFKDGKIVGYDPDIAALGAAKLGVKAQEIDTAWNGIIPALYEKKFDCIISGMTITKARSEKVLFSMPYADASNVMFLRADETRFKGGDDMSGKVVGVQLGGAAAGVVKAFEDKLKARGLPGYKEVKQYEHYPEAYQDLLNKRLDVVVNTISTLVVVMREAPGKFKIMPGVSDIKAYFGMAFRKEDVALQQFFNNLLATMKQDGTLAALQTKWFGTTMVTPNAVPDVLP